MYTTNKKKVTVILFLTAFVAFGVAGYNPPKYSKQDPSRYSKQDTFKNLQVLPKDISKDSLDKVMHHFSKSLGVKCGFCHVHTGEDFKTGWDMASDDKPEKLSARYMMRMTTSINTTYFNFDSSSRADTIRVITCNTCHRGIPNPDAEGIAGQHNNGDSLRQQPPPPARPGNN